MLLQRNPITKEIYKDNESDNVVALIDKSNTIFNKLVGINRCTMKFKKNKCRYGKYHYKDEDYIVIELNDNIKEEFIAFYNPIITVIISNNKKEILAIMEITSNVLVINKDDNKLKYLIWKNSYEKDKPIKIIYDENTEKSIYEISKYLNKVIEYKNIRWLSLYILKTHNYDLVKEYLDYDISNDKEFLDIIKRN